MIILLVSNATHFASRISLPVRATLKSEMTWRDLPFSCVSWRDFYGDFYDRGTPDMKAKLHEKPQELSFDTLFFSKKEKCKKRVIYFLVADVPVSPVWCVFATSVCRPKCSSRDLCCSVPALASLCHNGAFHHKLSTPCWLFFSPRLLCPYITPKTAVMRCCKDREKKKEKENGKWGGW